MTLIDVRGNLRKIAVSARRALFGRRIPRVTWLMERTRELTSPSLALRASVPEPLIARLS